jgi:hypothetical protein
VMDTGHVSNLILAVHHAHPATKLTEGKNVVAH